MASKRHQRRRQCGNKRKYDTPDQAFYMMNHIFGGNSGIYKCPFCNKWHIGRTPRKRLQWKDAI
jgi:hypothetical protein